MSCYSTSSSTSYSGSTSGAKDLARRNNEILDRQIAYARTRPGSEGYIRAHEAARERNNAILNAPTISVERFNDSFRR